MNAKRIAALTAAALAVLLPATPAVAAHIEHSWYNPTTAYSTACLDDAAEPVLAAFDLDGVDVLAYNGTLSPSTSDHTTHGVVSAAAGYDTILLLASTVENACELAPYGPDPIRELQHLIAHEAAHAAQHRLLGTSTNPYLAIGDALEYRKLAAALVTDAAPGVDGIEASADCTAIALGFPSPYHSGGIYVPACTDADLEAGRAVVDGRWPTTR